MQSANDFYELLGLSRDVPISAIEALNISSITSNGELAGDGKYDLATIIAAMRHPSKKALYDSWLRTSPSKGMGFLNTNLQGLDDDFAVITAIHQIDELTARKRLMTRACASTTILSLLLGLIFFLVNAISLHVVVAAAFLLSDWFAFGTFRSRRLLGQRVSYLNWQISEGHFGR